MAKNYSFSVILEPQQGDRFTVLVPALPEVITEGDTEQEALANETYLLDWPWGRRIVHCVASFARVSRALHGKLIVAASGAVAPKATGRKTDQRYGSATMVAATFLTGGSARIVRHCHRNVCPTSVVVFETTIS